MAALIPRRAERFREGSVQDFYNDDANHKWHGHGQPEFVCLNEFHNVRTGDVHGGSPCPRIHASTREGGSQRAQRLELVFLTLRDAPDVVAVAEDDEKGDHDGDATDDGVRRHD